LKTTSLEDAQNANQFTFSNFILSASDFPQTFDLTGLFPFNSEFVMLRSNSFVEEIETISFCISLQSYKRDLGKVVPIRV